MIMSLDALCPPSIPSLEGERVLLRPYRIDDLDAAFEMWSDDKVVEFIGGRARSRIDVWMQIQRMIGSWGLLGYGYWAIVRKSDQKYLGEVGFLEALREINPSLIGRPEAGWAVVQDVWGQGYASEAASVALDWAAKNLKGREAVCIIDPANFASIRIAERNGFNLIAEGNYREEPILIFSRRL